MIMIGVISDTHSLLRPQAKTLLAGSDLIIHAGDIGSPEVVSELRTIAPVRAVRGNIDRGDWARALPEDDVIEVAGLSRDDRLFVARALAGILEATVRRWIQHGTEHDPQRV